MNLYSQSDLIKNTRILSKIKSGVVFICPTDTIYSLSCIATNESAVNRLRTMKERPTMPLSIWAPNKEWIEKNCFITPNANKWLKKLPGPYTLILPLLNTSAVAPNVTCGHTTIGVRIPNHWFSEIVSKLNIPLITTSANISGEPHMTSLTTLNQNLKSLVEFIIYEDEKTARPSTIIDVEKEILTKR